MSERSHETAGVVKVERHVETLGPTDKLRELKLMQSRDEPSGEESLWGIVALELGTRGRLNSRILSSSASELSLEVSFISLKMKETRMVLVVEAIGLGLEGLQVALVLVEFATRAIVFGSNVFVNSF